MSKIVSIEPRVDSSLRFEGSMPMHGVEYFHVRKLAKTPFWPKFCLGTCMSRKEQVLQECLTLSETKKLYRFVPSTKLAYSILIMGSRERPRSAFEITRLDAFRAKIAEANFPKAEAVPGYMMTTQYVTRDAQGSIE